MAVRSGSDNIANWTTADVQFRLNMTEFYIIRK